MLRFIGNAAKFGVPYGLIMGLFVALLAGGAIGLIAGACCGLFFGLALAGFAEWQRSRFLRSDPCEEGERLVRQGPANQFRGREGVGGWLYLTNRRLLFRPHRFNVQNLEQSISLGEIRGARAVATLGLVPNGLLVETTGGPERFVVEGRRAWVEAIQQAREQDGDASPGGGAPDPEDTFVDNHR